jgi:hypothetical protein
LVKIEVFATVSLRKTLAEIELPDVLVTVNPIMTAVLPAPTA